MVLIKFSILRSGENSKEKFPIIIYKIFENNEYLYIKLSLQFNQFSKIKNNNFSSNLKITLNIHQLFILVFTEYKTLYYFQNILAIFVQFKII